MNRRIRVLAALLALGALSAYVGESIWASWCMPGMQADRSAAFEASDLGLHAGMHHGPADPSDGPERSRSDAPPCPLGMAGAGGSCVAASLPASSESVGPGAPTHAAEILSPDRAPDLLLVAAHFRPPRA